MEVDHEAALAELQQAETAGEEGQEQAQEEDNTEYYELPYNGETYKFPMNHEIPIYHNGQTQNVPFSKVINSYRNSAHLEQKQKELKDQLNQIKPEYDEFQNYKDKLYALQKWSEENPNDFDRLYQLYENKDQHLLANQGSEQAGLPPDHPLIKQVSTLSQSLNEMQEKLSKYEQMEQEQVEQSQVAEVEKEIEDFSKEFSGVSLDEADPEGITLREQILKFGAENGYPTFRSAAMDYRYPDGTPLLSRLLDTAKHEGRNETVKAVKRDNESGILKRSSTPSQGQGTAFDVRKLDNETRDELALEELSKAWGGA